MLLRHSKKRERIVARSGAMNVCCVIAVMTSMCFAENRGELVGNSETESLLRLLGRQIRSNQEAIRTWRGTLKVVEDNYWYGDQLKKYADAYRESTMMERAKRARRRVEATAEFAVDVVHDKVFTTWDADHRVELLDSGAYLTPKLRRSPARSVVTPEEYLHYEPDYNYGRFDLPVTDGIVFGKAAFRDPPEKAAGEDWGSIRDPRALFKYSGQTVYGLFEKAADQLGESGNVRIHGLPAVELRCLEDNGHTVYHFTSRYFTGNDDAYTSIVAVASSDVNHNVNSITTHTHYAQGSDTKVIENARLEWTYERVGDIFLPKKMRFLLNNSSGQPSFDSNVELVKSELNKPIPPELFTWHSLKLDEGARFIDRIRRLEFTHRNGELVPASFAHLVKEISEELLEEMSDELTGNRLYEVFLPRVDVARQHGRPYLLDFSRGELFFMDIGLDTNAAHDFLEEEEIGDIAWDGSFLAVRKAKALTPRHESQRPLTVNEGKYRWIRCYTLPEGVELPYSVIVVANEGGHYLMKVCAIESDGLRAVYRKLEPDEIESYGVKP
jgi:hypothetical protein